MMGLDPRLPQAGKEEEHVGSTLHCNEASLGGGMHTELGVLLLLLWASQSSDPSSGGGQP